MQCSLPFRSLALLFALGLVGGPQVSAQETSEDPFAEAQEADERPASGTGIEEIVITAEKREGLLQDTPAAISAFNSASLEVAGINSFEELSFNVPNVFFSRTGPGVNIAIRGVSTLGGDPAATFHVDGNYQASTIVPGQLTFFDIERVEVLRGPQGTLYGRNSTGGAINVITAMPRYEFEAFGDIQVGNYDQLFSRAAVNVPIVEDRLATRFSFYQELRDGYTRRLDPERPNVGAPIVTDPDPGLVRRNDPNDGRSWGGRGQIRTTPIDDIDIIVRGFYAKTFGAGPAFKQLGPIPSTVNLGTVPNAPIFLGASPNPDDPFEIRTDKPPEIDVVTWGLNLHFDWAIHDIPGLGDAQLTVNGSYIDRDFFNIVDSDSSDVFVVFNETDIWSREYVVDAHFASAGSGIEFDVGRWDWHLDWLFGFFYLGTEADTAIDAPAMPRILPPPLPPATSLAQLSNSTSSDSYGAYTQNELWFGEDVSLTLGFRYNWDRKAIDQFDEQVDFLLPPLPPICGVPEIIADESDSWDRVTGKVALNWKPHPDHLLYADWTPGYKSGTINTKVPSSVALSCEAIDVPNAKPEKILAYEIGSKNRFFDNRLQANLTGFYYDYDDLQVQQAVEATTIVSNAAKARVYGLEAEFIAVPVDNLTVTLNFTYLDAEFVDYENGFFVENIPQDCDLNPADEACVDFSGQPLPRAPKYTTLLAIQYDWDWGRFGRLIPYLQLFVSDDVTFRPGTKDQLCNARRQQAGFAPGQDPFCQTLFVDSAKQDNYLLLNLRTAWHSADDHVYVEAFINNVTNEPVANNKINATALLGAPVLTFFDAPRTYGARFVFRW